MKKLLIILGCVAAVVVIAVVAANLVLGNAENATYYDFGSDRVPTIKEVVGIREISEYESSTSGGVLTKTIAYKTDPSDKKQAAEDVAAYFSHITEKEGFISLVTFDGLPYEGGVDLEVAKESNDKGKIIILKITYDSKGYTFVFTKSEGTLTTK